MTTCRLLVMCADAFHDPAGRPCLMHVVHEVRAPAVPARFAGGYVVAMLENLPPGPVFVDVQLRRRADGARVWRDAKTIPPDPGRQPLTTFYLELRPGPGPMEFPDFGEYDLELLTSGGPETWTWAVRCLPLLAVAPTPGGPVPQEEA